MLNVITKILRGFYMMNIKHTETACRLTLILATISKVAATISRSHGRESNQ